MKFANATKFYRKSGAAEGSAVQRTSRGDVFRHRVVDGPCCFVFWSTSSTGNSTHHRNSHCLQPSTKVSAAVTGRLWQLHSIWEVFPQDEAG